MIKKIPEITGVLRSHMIMLPEIIREASGIRIFGKTIRSLVFTTDVAVIRNNNADAVIAVYPFTPQPLITQALVLAADVPVFCGVGGGITTGKRVVNLALDAEFKGAMGVVLNSPTPNDVIKMVKETIDIPIIITIVSKYEDFDKRIEAGANIINVSGSQKTPEIIRSIREKHPDFPIIATGGNSEASIKQTILAGANAISCTPAAPGEILREIMNKYRQKYQQEDKEN